ncbi:sugar-binding protein [Metabacillus malikii]|uniref:Ribose transport system substrate-binding protein n=1 Tax=Metabacillus malikii TaxID=1504265 RepID=A0ABT9ZCV3_9BACI|nr:sugar-binding protein [Metabacillus malikii]MDQ0230096.1 ribose transport system substrate-binding protein [Metabacillus malikii]
MKRKPIIYFILITLSILTIIISFYLFNQVQTHTKKLESALSPKASLPKYHFALIVEEMQHEYWQLVGDGAKAAASKHNVHVEYIGPERSNPEEQLMLIDKAIKSKVDGIIVQGLNESFTALINQAESQNIPVITIDTDSPDSKRHAYIGSDNYEAGQLAGKALVEDTNGKATVGIITASLENPHHMQRVQGFKDIVEKEKGIEIVAIKESKISRVEAEETAYDMLIKHNDITAFYGTSSYNGLGIVSAAKSLQKQNDMYVITFDPIDENMTLLRNGDIDAIVEQHPYEMGFHSIETMLEVMNGKLIHDVTHTESSIIRSPHVEQGGSS